jgi:hypothetical protein
MIAGQIHDTSIDHLHASTPAIACFALQSAQSAVHILHHCKQRMYHAQIMHPMSLRLDLTFAVAQTREAALAQNVLHVLVQWQMASVSVEMSWRE